MAIGLGPSLIVAPALKLMQSVHKTLAAICLAGLIYWLIATRLADMMKPPDEPEPEISAARRRKVPTVSASRYPVGMLSGRT